MTIKNMMSDKGFKSTDRDLQCADFLQSGLDEMIVDALSAGWSEDEICNAILSLAQDRVADSRDDAVIDIGPETSAYRH